jgi:hypothetical protein
MAHPGELFIKVVTPRERTRPAGSQDTQYQRTLMRMPARRIRGPRSNSFLTKGMGHVVQRATGARFQCWSARASRHRLDPWAGHAVEARAIIGENSICYNRRANFALRRERSRREYIQAPRDSARNRCRRSLHKPGPPNPTLKLGWEMVLLLETINRANLPLGGSEGHRDREYSIRTRRNTLATDARKGRVVGDPAGRCFSYEPPEFGTVPQANFRLACIRKGKDRHEIRAYWSEAHEMQCYDRWRQ